MLIYFSKAKQADGGFNNGEIIEKKPIGFIQDGGNLKPYSNLFYWSHAIAKTDSTIGEHQHKGFEIVTFVLNGAIEHYDSQFKRWKKLMSGDVQIIKAGNGISHSERLYEGSSVFQIWFDPDLSKSMNREAVYQDFSSEKFPIHIERDKSILTYKGPDSPLELTAEGVEIREYSFSAKEYTLKADKKKIFSAFLIEGEIYIEDKKIYKEDFFIIRNQEEIKLRCASDSRLFVIESPTKTRYKTYAEMNNIQHKFA